jgi:hypothetical protein
MLRWFWTLSTAATAWLKDVLGAKLKEIVTTGNWPWCAMVKGLDLFSKCAIAERGIADEVDAEVELELLPVPEEAGEDVEVTADMPDAPFLERAEVLVEDESAPEVGDDRTDAPAAPERLDCCDPAIPLVEETESVGIEEIVLLEAVLPDVDVGAGLAPVEDEALWR